MKFLRQFINEDRGTTAVEYGVMLALLLLTMIASVAAFGGSTGAWWGGIESSISSYF